MVETITRKVGPLDVTVLLCGCEVCGNVWLARGEPERCASSKCRARSWRGVVTAGPPVVTKRHKKERKRLQLVTDRPAVIAVQPQEDSPGTVRCRLCGVPILNAFAMQHHACKP